MNSKLKTSGVDAFTLALIKAEKQMRRVFTYLIFQNPSYSSKLHKKELRKTLAENKKIYFEGFEKGINLILNRSIKDIYGSNYKTDIVEFRKLTKERNKIFHGQITAEGLSASDLIKRVKQIKKWCENLSNKLWDEIGYDGFTNSYCKSKIPLTLNNLDRFDTVDKYKTFLEGLERKTNQH